MSVCNRYLLLLQQPRLTMCHDGRVFIFYKDVTLIHSAVRQSVVLPKIS